MNKSYENEVLERFGNTDAYKESKAKTADYTNEKWNSVISGMEGIFAEFAEYNSRGESADGACELVEKLRDYITENFYNCTDEILAGLGQMYVCDERFKANIDKHGEGTTEYAAAAIAAYTKRVKK